MNKRDDVCRPFCSCGKVIMDKLNLYTVDLKYVEFLKNAEKEKRGFSRFPNMNYGNLCKPKFLQACFYVDFKYGFNFSINTYTFVPGAAAEGSFSSLILSSFIAFAMAASIYGNRI